MTATTQHGPHPPGAHLDAELLSAFAEHALPAHERNHVLEHLAACTRCRQIIALSASAQELESHTLAAAAAAAPAVHRRTPNPWWTRWRLVWIPAAVVGALTVTIVSIDLHRTKPDGVTIEIAKQAPPDVGRSEAPSPSEPANATPPALSRDATQPAASPASSAPTEQRKAAPQPSAKSQPHSHSATAPADPLELIAAPPEPPAFNAGAAAAPAQMLPSEPKPAPPAVTETVTVASDQSAPETASAQQSISLQPALKAANSPLRATPPPPAAAPASPQLQAEREKKFAEFNRQVETAETSDHLSAARANPQSAPVAAAVSGSNASGAAYTQPAASNHGSIASFGSLYGLSSSAGLAGNPIHLPSGLALASIASSGRLMLAVDKAGALFLTHDSGVTWRQVSHQWTGRAVLVRTRNLADRRAESATATPSDAGLSTDSPAPSIVFEIVNEKNQVWQSADGLVWAEK